VNDSAQNGSHSQQTKGPNPDICFPTILLPNPVQIPSSYDSHNGQNRISNGRGLLGRAINKFHFSRLYDNRL
jgi:hypothetical protein